MATFTFDEFLVYVNNLPSKFEKASQDINMEMAKSLQRRIRTRAPSGSTGSLKNIKIEKRGENVVLTGPNHWFFVNAGMATTKAIPIEAIKLHNQNPGATAGQKLHIPKDEITGWFVPASTHIRGKGFVDKSITSLEKDLPRIFEMGINKALQK